MQENINLTREHVIFLAFMGIVGNIVYTHTWIDDYTDRAAWVASLVGILLVIPFAIWIFYLGKFYPKCTVFDILETGFGKFPFWTVSVIYILINIAIAVAHLNLITQMINAYFLQHTPAWVIMFFLLVIGIMFANGGIKEFARLVEILVILGLINYFSAFIFSYPKFFHIEYIIPIFDTSLNGFIKGTIFITGGASECLLLFMVLVRLIPDPAKHYMWIVIGIGLSSIIFSSAIMIILAMMSPELAERIAFGGVNASSLIRIGDFIQGLELFIFGTYQFIAIGKTTMSMYCAWTSAKKMFNIKNPLLLLLIIALMIFVPSVWLSSYNKAYFLAVFLGNYVILPFSIFILLLTSLSIVIKNKRAGSASK